MRNFLEFHEKTIEKALEKASLELNVVKRNLNYEIVTNGSAGFLGFIGSKNAIIKVFFEVGKKIVTKKIGFKKKYYKSFFKRSFKNDEKLLFKDSLKLGKSVLKRIVDSITKNTSINMYKQNHQIVFEVNGGVSGVLIGKKGQTLEAMQYIVEKIVNKNSSKRVRILIDVEGYLKKKRDSLHRLAIKMLDRVRKTKKPATIGQMNSHDRRVIHTYLKCEQDVRTQSVGSGYYRKLMIFPQKDK